MSATRLITRFWWALLGTGLLAAGLALGLPAMTTSGADHLEAPLVMADGRLDINDIYVFHPPGSGTPGGQDLSRTVMVMTVNPLAGVSSPTTFHPGARYEFLVDNNGDAKPDLKFKVRFSEPDAEGVQDVRLRQSGGRMKARGETGEDIPVRGGGTLRVDTFDDPFFFDLVAFQAALGGTGTIPRTPPDTPTDFFAGLNVSAIVLEVPSSALMKRRHGSSNIGVWGRTVLRGKQVDRMGRPAINTVFIPSGNKDAFNAGKPRRDRRDFNSDVVGSLLFLSGLDGTPYSGGEAQAIADVLLPDVLTADLSAPTGFLNGRNLDDDVIDAELPIATGGFFGGSPVLTTDGVPANDASFPTSFPYLAAPHSGP